jgi:hypothetical protein
MDRNRTGLTKTELLWRLWSRAPSSIAPAITAVWLNDLLKDGLIPRAERLGNDGRRPIYLYDFRAYRRARQIIRFRQFGVLDRDSLTVLLFINGYGVPPHLVREALAREWARWATNIVGQVRSGYMSNWRDIPPKHKSALVRELGPLDPHLRAIGAPHAPDFAIEMFRSAIQSPLADEFLPRLVSGLQKLSKSLSIKRRVADLLISAFAGLLMVNPTSDGKMADGVQKLVVNAGDADLDFARRTAMELSIAIPSRWTTLFPVAAEVNETQVADRVVQRTIRNQPAFATLLLIIGLRFAPLFRGFPKDVKLGALQWMKRPFFLKAISKISPNNLFQI